MTPPSGKRTPWSHDRHGIFDANGKEILDGEYNPAEVDVLDFIVQACNAYDDLMEEHKDGECYCLNPEESLGRNPCGHCKVENIMEGRS